MKQAKKVGPNKIKTKTPQLSIKAMPKSTRAKKKYQRQAEADGEDICVAQKKPQLSQVKPPINFAPLLG